MGIRHLQTFMQESVPGGFVDVSIIDECEQYQSKNNGEKPTLVIDLMGALQILNRNVVDMLYGGRHGEYYKQMDRLFQRLSEIATLVFFKDGPVAAKKMDTWIERQENRYYDSLDIMDQIYAGVPIETIVKNSRNIPTITSPLEIITNRAKAYGTLVVAVTKDCDAEIAQYACNNPSVIAVMANDTDFLIFPGDWRYFSLLQIDEETLQTKEFSRTALREYLQLDSEQLMVLSTIAGNDILKYDDVKHRHYSKFGNRSIQKFPAMAQLIRDKIDTRDFEGLCWKLAKFLLRDESETSIERIIDSLGQYNLRFRPIDHSQSDPLLNFCRVNSYNAVYELLSGAPSSLKSTYHDLRKTDRPQLYSPRLQMLKRTVGVILQHRRTEVGEIKFDLYAKRSRNESFQLHIETPEYPEATVPPLLELLDRPKYPEHDEIRFQLLKWIISDDLTSIDLSEIPDGYLANVLTLFFMVRNEFISVIEADLILLAIKHVVLDILPTPLDKPPVVDKLAFRIAFIYSGLFSNVGKAIKICGFRQILALNNFDGAFFHKLYLKYKNTSFNPLPLLTDVNSYRIYAKARNDGIPNR